MASSKLNGRNIVAEALKVSAETLRDADLKDVYTDGNRLYTTQTVGVSRKLPGSWNWAPLPGSSFTSARYGKIVYVASDE